MLGLKAEALAGMLVVDRLYQAKGRELVITSVTDSKHGPGSLHYSGQAFDCRTAGISPEEQASIAAAAKSSLTSEFDVLLEADHLHIEYQPKG